MVKLSLLSFATHVQIWWGRKLNLRLWEIQSFPSLFLLLIKGGITLPHSTVFSFLKNLKLSLPNTKQVTYGFCQLYYKPSVSFNKNKMNVCFSFQFCSTHLPDKWCCWLKSTLSSKFFCSRPVVTSGQDGVRGGGGIKSNHNWKIVTQFFGIQMGVPF